MSEEKEYDSYFRRHCTKVQLPVTKSGATSFLYVCVNNAHIQIWARICDDADSDESRFLVEPWQVVIIVGEGWKCNLTFEW